LPVDSEHNAIFQSLPPEAQEKVGFCPLKELGALSTGNNFAFDCFTASIKIWPQVRKI